MSTFAEDRDKKVKAKRAEMAIKARKYVFKRGQTKSGVPTLKIEDRYLAPLIINTYEFAFTGTKEQAGYGALMIEKLIKALEASQMARKVIPLYGAQHIE